MGMEGDAIDRRGKLAFSSVFFYKRIILCIITIYIYYGGHANRLCNVPTRMVDSTKHPDQTLHSTFRPLAYTEYRCIEIHNLAVKPGAPLFLKKRVT